MKGKSYVANPTAFYDEITCSAWGMSRSAVCLYLSRAFVPLCCNILFWSWWNRWRDGWRAVFMGLVLAEWSPSGGLCFWWSQGLILGSALCNVFISDLGDGTRVQPQQFDEDTRPGVADGPCHGAVILTRLEKCSNSSLTKPHEGKS